MSNVIELRPKRKLSKTTPQSRLITCFAQHRRQLDDVFWLKENAELLGILSATDVELPPKALHSFEAFYADIEERMQFFPQYYRFLISICLDLEDLGLGADKGARLCSKAHEFGLAEAELSDLQRAEARRLLARRYVGTRKDDRLDQRLHAFIERTDTFALPNKKAAYELTHIVFYLAEYGRRDPRISDRAVTSLEYAGLLAYLDQNIDLLAEICAALRFAGQRPSEIWERAVRAAHGNYLIVADAGAALNDAYHEYLVTGWAARIAGGAAFGGDLPEGSLRFTRQNPSTGALRGISEQMFQLGAARNGDWTKMRGNLAAHLGQGGQDILRDAERSTDKFDAFFAGFARASLV